MLHDDRKSQHWFATNLLVAAASGGAFKTNTFSTVQADITDINSNYHSLQISGEKRMSHGVTVLANYTYSKSMDDLPFGEGVSGFDTGLFDAAANRSEPPPVRLRTVVVRSHACIQRFVRVAVTESAA